MSIRDLIPSKKPQSSDGSEKMDTARRTVSELIEMDKEGKLAYEVEEYVNSKEFLALLEEYPVKACVRIFEAERNAQNAKDEGRQAALDDVAKRRAMPVPMKNTARVSPEEDFSKMSTEEFNRIKARLAQGK